MTAMSTIGQNIVKLREAAGFGPVEFARKISEQLGEDVSNVKLWRWENDKTRPKDKHIAAIASVLNIKIGQLVSGDVNSIAILGYVGAGEPIHMIDADTTTTDLEHVEVPIPLPEGCGALIVKGSSQYPVYEEGDLIIIQPADVALERLIDAMCVVAVTNGPILLKKITRGRSASRYTLTSHNAPPIENVEVDWARPVMCIFRKGRW